MTIEQTKRELRADELESVSGGYAPGFWTTVPGAENGNPASGGGTGATGTHAPLQNGRVA
jgi:hypothetical protein